MGAESPLVSVIVPVFDAEAYLGQCVGSLLGQSFKDFELLLVDDASSDGSGALCDALAAAHEKVRAIHKGHGGPGDTRNHGVALSKGAWIAFVDADDVVSPDLLDALARCAKDAQADMVALPGGTTFRGDKTPALAAQGGSPSGTDARCETLDPREYLKLMMCQRVSCAPQFRLTRKEVLWSEPFPVDLLHDDLASTYRQVRACASVALLDRADLYGYRISPQGITRRAYTHEKGVSAVVVTRGLRHDMSQWYPEMHACVCSRCFATLRTIFAQAASEGSADADMLWGELEPLASTVASDGDARLRDRLSAVAALAGRGPFEAFCAACRTAGLMA